VAREIHGGERAPVRPDAIVAPDHARWDRDLDRLPLAISDSPKRRRALMAERSARSACENRRHPTTLAREDGRADRVHVPVHPKQPASAGAVLDAVSAQSACDELCTGHHPVLSRRDGEYLRQRRLKSYRAHRPDKASIAPACALLAHFRRLGRAYQGSSSAISDSRGADRSRSESTGSALGHSTATSGSSQAIPASVSGS
jgi:hypothetical protein